MSLVTLTPTMTSREIADLVESRHDSVKRAIERLFAAQYHDDGTVKRAPVIAQPPMVDGAKAANGVNEAVYLIGKRDSYVIVAQLSPEFTARLVDRWQELEAQAAPAPAFALPQTYAQALLEAGRLAALVEEKNAQIAAAAPAVAFVDRFVEAKSSKCLSDVAKLLGWKPQAFIAKLSDDGVIFKRGGSWVPTQGHIDAGRFTVKTGEASGHAFQQTRVTPAGVEWLAKRMQAVAAPKLETEKAA